MLKALPFSRVFELKKKKDGEEGNALSRLVIL